LVEERGYTAIGYKGLSFEDLRYFDGPIVSVSFHGYNHYVVYKGLTQDGNVWLADPAYGNRTLSDHRLGGQHQSGDRIRVLDGEPTLPGKEKLLYLHEIVIRLFFRFEIEFVNYGTA